MMLVHNQGQAVCGAYPYDIAETKVDMVRELAARDGFPLQAALEEDGE